MLGERNHGNHDDAEPVGGLAAAGAGAGAAMGAAAGAAAGANSGPGPTGTAVGGTSSTGSTSELFWLDAFLSTTRLAIDTLPPPA